VALPPPSPVSLPPCGPPAEKGALPASTAAAAKYLQYRGRQTHERERGTRAEGYTRPEQHRTASPIKHAREGSLAEAPPPPG
jgi:hypothetical protein